MDVRKEIESFREDLEALRDDARAELASRARSASEASGKVIKTIEILDRIHGLSNRLTKLIDRVAAEREGELDAKGSA